MYLASFLSSVKFLNEWLIGSLSASLQESWSLKEDQVLSCSHVITLFFLLSKSATDVKVADMVREALEEAEKAQIAAEKAIKQADEDIQEPRTCSLR